MSQDYPPLALDDLVHLMSPSPAPQPPPDVPDSPPRTKSPSPEPLPESDIVHMRRKVMEMRHIDQPDAQLTRREKELVDMVLRLTAAVRPDPDQLLRQADTISALIQQRDLLLNQAEELRLRWNSEKDGWARTAEALLAQQAKNRLNVDRDEDSERLLAVETDNKGLRQRFNEAQSRLQMLESELARLRPLLLMQPLISRSSLPPPTPTPKAQATRRRKRDAAATEDETHGSSEDEPQGDPIDTPSHPSYSQVNPKPKSRKSEAPSNIHPTTNPPKRRPHKVSLRGFSADARAEHLLLAARKIGKHRAGIISGMVQHLEDRERERRREDSATTAIASPPKTPKRNISQTGYPPEGAYVYFGGQMRSGPGMQPVPMFISAYHHHLLQTPSSSTTAPSASSSMQTSAQKSKRDAKANNPPTPLDSLLSAARSMMREDIDVEVDDDEEIDVVGDSPVGLASARQTRPKDTGSPVPKRRKVGARTDKLTLLHGPMNRVAENTAASSANTNMAANAEPSRVMSALDVLADQAAAFSTHEQPITQQAQTPTQMEGKGKERANSQSQELSSSTPKPRGRTKSRRREPEAITPTPTPSPAALPSRSGTPRSDIGDDQVGASPSGQPQAGGTASDVLVDPGGGSSSTSTSQAHDSISVSKGNEVTTNDGKQSTGPPDELPHVEDPAGASPTHGARSQDLPSEDELNGAHATTAQPGFAQLPVPPSFESEDHEASPLLLHGETTPPIGQNSSSSSSGVMSTASVQNKELLRVVEQDTSMSAPPAKRQRSPYVKWSKEEDDLLAQERHRSTALAVAKYGQKWDLVQKALPSRGYHQVRQRWLRKLGVFDSKPDLSSFQTAVTTFPSTSRGEGAEPRGNPKLGLAPLSSEKAFTGLVGRPPS